MHLAEFADRVTLVIRGESLDAGMSHYLVQQIEDAPNIGVRVRTEVIDGKGDPWLESLVLLDRDGGETETVRADALFVMIGADPSTDWLPDELARDEGGFIRTGPGLEGDDGWPLERDPLALETSIPAVFAVGDVRHGSMGRVAAAVGEGSTAIRLVHELFELEASSPPVSR
jgi:thioredoxin reductase (NADPH)